MGLFGLFSRTVKQTEEAAAAERARREDLEVYSGMRVEVTSADRRMFLVAHLQGLRGDRAQLRPSTEGSLMTPSEAPVSVTLRGYSSKGHKAVLLNGTVRLTGGGVWQVEHLSLVKQGDNRAHVRILLDAEGTLCLTGGRDTPEESCRLVNIGLGGVCVCLETRRDVGDKFILRVKLVPEGETLVLHGQFLRILERRHGCYEYGCRFVDLEPADEERILRSIFALQNRA